MKNKHKYFMGLAEAASVASPDAETKVGSILVSNKNNVAITSSFNGFLRKAPDDRLPNTKPDKYQYFIHSEANLIYHCAKLGISMDDCMVYCTLTPCINCMKALWQCGITKVVAKEAYRDFSDLQNLLDIKIDVQTDAETGFLLLEYGPAT